MNMKVQLLGVRGSISVSGSEYQKYGTATTSVLVTWSEKPTEAIVLDAGTGILKLEKHLPKTIKKLTVLLSHPHLDHIGGLLMLPLMFRKDIEINIYAETREGLSARDQLEALMQPPTWPVKPMVFSQNVHFHALDELDDACKACKISYIEGNHPGGVTIYRLEHDGKSLVFATDYEIGKSWADAKLTSFATGCDLLLGDGAYRFDELYKTKGFGHSSWEQMTELGMDCEAKNIKIIHHSPFNDDEALDEADCEVKAITEQASIAMEDEVIML